MKQDEWISAEQACAQLGVRKQTLYAYASRKVLRVMQDPSEARRSLYSARDVAHLAQSNRRPRARADVAAGSIRWGDPVLETRISGVHNDTLYFGSARAVDLAQSLTLEDVAARHMGVAVLELPDVGAYAAANGALGTPMARGLAALAEMAVTAPASLGRGRDALAKDGAKVMAHLAYAMTGRTEGLVHSRLAKEWGLDKDGANLIRMALVLLSDHELNPSTFAVRVCASTGGSLAACTLAGLATLSGPKHGGVAGKSLEALRAGQAGTFDSFVTAQAGLRPYSYGFGHPLYPDGDPRAHAILQALDAPICRTVQDMSVFLGIPSNVDAALSAMTLHHDLPADAALTIFALGRVAGWIAHAIEQSQSDQIIRPRARFTPSG